MSPHQLPSELHLHLLPPECLRMERDAFGHCHLTTEGKRWEKVDVRRTFPLSRPEEDIVVRTEDGREIGIIARLSDLAPDSREVVREALELQYLNTRVLRVRRVDSRFGVTTWQVDTDRGRRSFHVRDRADIRSLGGGRVVLSDVDGIRYLVPDLNALDDLSRRRLEDQL